MTEPYTILPWDSDFFEFRVVRIVPERLSESELRTVLSLLCKEHFRLAYWSSDPGDQASQQAATACEGFLADKKMTYAIDINRESPMRRGADGSVITKYTEAAPSPALLRLAMESGRYSRFHVDKKFPDALFRKLYEHWMSASVDKAIADEVFVACYGLDIVGMITVRKDTGHGTIGLIAVAPAMQGRGVGSSLIAEAHRWFLQEGLSRSKVVTQGANIAACKLYESCGYRLERIEHLYHFWMGPHDHTLQ